LIQIGKRVLHKLQTIPKLRRPIGSHRKNTGIAVNANHLIGAGVEQIFTIAPGPKGAINPSARNGCGRVNQW